MALTAKQIENAKGVSKAYKLSDRDGLCLSLRRPLPNFGDGAIATAVWRK